MNNTDLGRVHAFLLRNRIAETVSSRRTISREERDIAIMLRDADPQMLALLDEILDGQGLHLKSFNSLEAAGIPEGGVVFVLARKPDSMPPFFGFNQLLARMKQIRGSMDRDMDAKVWFVQLWFILLDILYSRKSRSPNALQDWVDTTFRRDIFIEAVKEYINDHVRKIPPEEMQTDVIHKILTAPKEGTVTQACNAFLELMGEAKLLEPLGDDAYRQTLLFAYEMKVNFDRQLAPLLPSQNLLESASTILIEEAESEEI